MCLWGAFGRLPSLTPCPGARRTGLMGFLFGKSWLAALSGLLHSIAVISGVAPPDLLKVTKVALHVSVTLQ